MERGWGVSQTGFGCKTKQLHMQTTTRSEQKRKTVLLDKKYIVFKPSERQLTRRANVKSKEPPRWAATMTLVAR